MKSLFAIASLGTGLVPAAAGAAPFTVQAAANSSTGGTGLPTINFGRSDLFRQFEHQ